jgi:hypothetical protein
MANPFNAYRNNNLNPNTLQKDYAHAARLFADDNFRLAPKLDFLFHVSFNINAGALKDQDLKQRHKNEINMLVKNVTLPKFTLQTETVNQYNRKHVVQVQHKFDPCTIKFHDDNMGLISKLWQNYYAYYYADSTTSNNGGAYSRNAYKKAPEVPYGLDSGAAGQFFSSITIYQLARHEWFAFKLINPMIASFDHQTMDYSKTNTAHELAMTLNYEAVNYSTGTITADTPEGFGAEHYDQTPSPLTLPAGVTALKSSAVTTETPTRTLADVNNAVTTINSYQNSQGLSLAGTTGIATTSSIKSTALAGLGGVQGTAFPIAPATNITTVKANQINITGNNNIIFIAQ